MQLISTTIDAMRRTAGYRFPRLGPVAFNLFRKFAPRHIASDLFPSVCVDIDLSDPIQACAYWQGSRYEHPTGQILCSWINQVKAPKFFDIGANFGFFSYLVQSRFRHVDTYAFEPGPTNFDRLRKAKSRSRLTHLHPYQLGLADSSGQLALHLALDDSGHSTFGLNPHYQGHESRLREVMVPVTTFQEWAMQTGLTIPLAPQWVVKMDIEGFELRALRGMEPFLKAHAFAGLCVEINEHTLNFCGTSAEEVYAYLAGFGYAAHDEELRATTPLASEMRNVFFLPGNR